jgi:hypothetical protein
MGDRTERPGSRNEDAIGSKPVLVLASVFRQHGSIEVIWLAHCQSTEHLREKSFGYAAKPEVQANGDQSLQRLHPD